MLYYNYRGPHSGLTYTRNEYRTGQNTGREIPDGTATAEEAAALHAWYDQVNAGDTEIVTTEQPTSLEDTRARILRRMQEQISAERQPPAVIRSARRKWLPAAAAALLLILAGGSYLLRKSGDKDIAPAETAMTTPPRRATAPRSPWATARW